MDVAKPKQIEQGFEQIDSILKKSNKKLIGLVNNAGVSGNIPTEYSTHEWTTKIINPNLIGLMDVTSFAIPYLRESSGRIINIGSMKGTIALGYDAPYVAAKSAVEGLCDCWRRELHSFNISVSCIQAGFIATAIKDKNIGENSASKALNLSVSQMNVYKKYFDKAEEQRIDFFNNAPGPERSTTPDIIHALTSPYPKTRYQPGISKGLIPIWMIPILKGILPDRLVDIVVYDTNKY